MKKFLIQFILLVIFIAAAMVLYVKPEVFPLKGLLPKPQNLGYLQINDVKIKVEVADTQAKRSKGLGGKESLPEGEGMLFVFDRADRYPFWMKDLKFALDFVWIRGDRVVGVLENVQPPAPGTSDSDLPVFQAEGEVDKVLELKAGEVKRLNIKKDDTVILTTK